MIKTNIFKTVFLFHVMAVMFSATALTAYALEDNNIENENEINLHDNGEEIFDEQPTDDEPETQEPPFGSLIIINSTHDGQLLGGAVFSLYRVGDDTPITEMITHNNGRTEEIPMPYGNYNIVVVTPANNHLPVSNMVSTTITTGQRQELTIYSVPIQVPTPTPEPPQSTSTPEPIQQPQESVSVQPSQAPAPIQQPSVPAQNATPNRPTQAQSRVEITTRAEQSGSPLNGTTFTVYRASDNQSVGEITTDENGKAYISLAQGEYYLRNESVQYGFLRERSRIFFTVKTSGTVAVEVTIQRDASIPYVDTGSITVPKTGELPPVMNYMTGSLLLAVALFCGFGLLKQDKPKKRKGALAYA